MEPQHWPSCSQGHLAGGVQGLEGSEISLHFETCVLSTSYPLMFRVVVLVATLRRCDDFVIPSPGSPPSRNLVAVASLVRETRVWRFSRTVGGHGDGDGAGSASCVYILTGSIKRLSADNRRDDDESRHGKRPTTRDRWKTRNGAGREQALR